MYTQTFRPASQGAFLPQVRLGGSMTRRVAYPVQPFLGAASMGATTEEWYKRASAALERYNFLKGQIQTINNDMGRASITAWLGSTKVDESPEYRYASVADDFRQAKAEGLQVYDVDRRTNRIEKLEEVNDEFNKKLEAARVSYGTRPAPAAGAPPAAPSAGPDLTVPLLVAGGAIAAAIIFG